MIIPRFSVGAKIDDLVPNINFVLEFLIACHALNLSCSVKDECISAGLIPILVIIRSMNCEVNPISGTNIRHCLFF